MALPKALLCTLPSLDGQNPVPQEDHLRASGFATAVIGWKELHNREQDWMQLSPVLDDPSVTAFVLAGRPDEFTPEVVRTLSLWLLSLTGETPPVTALVMTEAGEPDRLPPLLDHVAVFGAGVPFAGKLMAARFKPRPKPAAPFHLQAHLDPLIGLWMELGPHEGDVWQGFMAGFLDAECVAAGVGKRGLIPARSTLEYPMLGIKGEAGGRPFDCCAAKNSITAEESCFIKASAKAGGLLVGRYPEEEEQAGQSEARLLLFA